MITIKLGAIPQPPPEFGEAVISAQYDPLTQTFHLRGRTLTKSISKRDLERYVLEGAEDIAADQGRFLLRSLKALTADAGEES